MMKQHGIKLEIGSKIVGKWNKNSYIIQKELGAGTVGNVYLCRSSNQLVAMKISKQSASIITEGNVLRELNKVQEESLGPCLFDIDDWEVNGEIYSFYTMEYIEGVSLDVFIKRRGREWIGVLLLQMLNRLEVLHRHGWVFGDLKIENLIVTLHPVRIRLIDVGGTTKIGRAIKEHTDFFDRGYWGLGSRRAEPSYDLFALAMVFLAIYYPHYFPKGKDPQRLIIRKFKHTKALKPYLSIFKKAIQGHYVSSTAMKKDVIYLIRHLQKRKKDKRSDRIPFFVESVCLIGASLLYYLSAKLFF